MKSKVALVYYITPMPLYTKRYEMPPHFLSCISQNQICSKIFQLGISLLSLGFFAAKHELFLQGSIFGIASAVGSRTKGFHLGCVLPRV